MKIEQIRGSIISAELINDNDALINIKDNDMAKERSFSVTDVRGFDRIFVVGNEIRIICLIVDGVIVPLHIYNVINRLGKVYYDPDFMKKISGESIDYDTFKSDVNKILMGSI